MQGVFEGMITVKREGPGWQTEARRKYSPGLAKADCVDAQKTR